MNQLIILLALCGQVEQDAAKGLADEWRAIWTERKAQEKQRQEQPYESTLNPPRGWSVPEPDEERTTRQKIDDGRAQYLRQKWLTQTLVTERTTDPYRIQHIKDELSLLSSKEVLNIQKELDRRSRIQAARYFSRKAEYNRRVRNYYRPRPYFYYWWGPRGYTFRYGTARRHY